MNENGVTAGGGGIDVCVVVTGKTGAAVADKRARVGVVVWEGGAACIGGMDKDEVEEVEKENEDEDEDEDEDECVYLRVCKCLDKRERDPEPQPNRSSADTVCVCSAPWNHSFLTHENEEDVT